MIGKVRTRVFQSLELCDVKKFWNVKMTDKKNSKHEKPAAEKPAPENEPAARPPPAPAPPAAEIDLAAMKDRLLRLQADFDNFRKRTLREKAEWSLSANENILRELIPVLDHFELGLKTSLEHKTEVAVHHGFQMVYDQLIGALKIFGVTPLDVHESGFDPTHHEAVAHIPSDEYPADEIIAQTRRGWKLGEKLLRPVQVVISAGPGAPRDDELGQSQAEGAVPPEPSAATDTDTKASA